ncbi:beta-lactamase family protein [Bacillus shivajii]|uniref:serine hydrolase domain-containing protein n=1 Tax=Bacillus shivajii TaxID=1983719 RepID=UPI001CFA68F6|nr:serine hydrolase domain-containing protein [Bacillus shivajii]UCZ52987.1 beta-lactamase family protein [Bacillus shivajii]
MKAFHYLESKRIEKQFSGATAVITQKGRNLATFYTGYIKDPDAMTSVEKESLKVDMKTMFDAASLTKVCVTLPLTLKLIEQGELHLGDRVATFIPQFDTDEKNQITIEHLLTHTSGMKTHIKKSVHGWKKEDIFQYIYESAMENPVGETVLYSDFGFILLSKIIETVTGKSFQQLASDEIFQPLDMTESCFCPSEKQKHRIAMTEYDKEQSKWVWGQVHDETARVLNGVSGHAGLFTTATDLSRYLIMITNDDAYKGREILSEATINLATKNYTKTQNGNRGLGWVLKNDSFDASGIHFSDESYGHTGFTGTSMWFDPADEIGVILLTNRVHYGRDIDMKTIREQFHNLVKAA